MKEKSSVLVSYKAVEVRVSDRLVVGGWWLEVEL